MTSTASRFSRASIPRAELRAHSLWLAALLSLAASGIHFSVAPEHFDEYWLFGWFFIVAAWLQGVFAIALAGLGPNPRLLGAGVIGNTGLVALWLWTRIIGVPLGPESGDTEAFAWIDGFAGACEVGVVMLAGIALRRGSPVRASRWTVSFIVGLSVLLVAVVGVVLENRDSDGGHSEEQSGAGAHE